jgi:CBS domain containing-hemolysin-like protein
MLSEMLYDTLINLDLIGFFMSFFIFIIMLHILNDFYMNYKDAFANILLPINTIFNFLMAPLFYLFDFTKHFVRS